MTNDTSANGARGPILVLEDNAMIAEGVQMQLEDAGYTLVDLAATSDHALELIEDDPPICAILDLKLAGGLTSEPVAQDLTQRGIPFAFLTGFETDNPILRRFEAAPVMTKPLPQDQLVRTLNGLLGA